MESELADRLLESYTHKTVSRVRPGMDLRLRTSRGLFSSHSIDPGSNHLLRKCIGASSRRVFSRGLDLGCGYGVLGLSLLAAGTCEKMDMVDRDALAVGFADANAKLNEITGASVFGSLDLQDVETDDYDLVVSNLPGKTGPGVLRHLVATSFAHLAADGELWGVVVAPLWPQIESILEDMGANEADVFPGSRHVAFRAVRPESVAGDIQSCDGARAYSRVTSQFEWGGRSMSVSTSFGLSEFDELGYETQMLLQVLGRIRGSSSRSCVVFNVGQGHIPLAVRAAGLAESVQLVDRDLLALRTTLANLERNDMISPVDSTTHSFHWLPGLEEPLDLVVGVFRGDEPQEALGIGVRSLIERLQEGGTALVAGGSTPITRVMRVLNEAGEVVPGERIKNRGASAIIFRKRDLP